MSVRLTPGVYNEERRSAPPPIQGVATSILALVGFSTRGPVDEPMAFNSFAEFTARCGTFTSKSITPLQAYIFFANGGQQIRFVRVVGNNASASEGALTQSVSADDAGSANGTSTAYNLTLANAPVKPGSLSHAYWHNGTPVSGESGPGAGSNPRTGTAAALQNGIRPGTFTATDGVEVFTDNSDGTLTGDQTGTGTVNYLTGAYSLTYNTAPIAGTTVGYTPMIHRTGLSDDGDGILTGTGWSGTIDYETGEISATYATAPATIYPIAAGSVAQDLLFNYIYALFSVDAAWPGEAGDDFVVQISGSPDFEDTSEATFTRWDLAVLERAEDGTLILRETFPALDFDDPLSPNFVVARINDPNTGSDIIRFTNVGNDGVPSTLKGRVVSAQVGTGNGTQTIFTFTAADSIAPGTVRIEALPVSGTLMVVTDDGAGNLTGSINGSGTNTVNYETGVVTVTFASAVANASPVDADYYLVPEASEVTIVLENGSDGDPLAASNVVAAGLQSQERGLYALNKLDDLLMVIVPDFAGVPVVDQVLVDYCTARKDRFAILSVPEGLNQDQIVTYRKFQLARNQSYAALYAPWLQVPDPFDPTRSLTVPPLAHVAGVYARTDDRANVGKAPAGIEDGSLRYVTGLERSFSTGAVGTLYSNRVNMIVDWTQVGSTPTVWGAKTLDGTGEFGQIGARRLFQFVEKSVFNSAHGYIFESNDPSLWNRINFAVTSFLTNLFNQGFFAGETAEDAFFVVVDETNNPPESVAAGNLFVDVGIAPQTPAEFIVFRYQQIRS